MRYELTDRDWFAEHLDLREIVTPGLGELLRASLFAAFGHSSPPPERASLLSRCKDAAAASMFPPVVHSKVFKTANSCVACVRIALVPNRPEFEPRWSKPPWCAARH